MCYKNNKLIKNILLSLTIIPSMLLAHGGGGHGGHHGGGHHGGHHGSHHHSGHHGHHGHHGDHHGWHHGDWGGGWGDGWGGGWGGGWGDGVYYAPGYSEGYYPVNGTQYEVPTYYTSPEIINLPNTNQSGQSTPNYYNPSGNTNATPATSGSGSNK